MRCTKCGKKTPKNKGVCSTCGKEPVNTAPKNRNKIILTSVALAAFIFLISAVIFVGYVFPFKVTCETGDSTVTDTGTFANMTFKVESNQIIRDIYYAVDPANSENINEYNHLKANGSWTSKTVVLPDFEVPAGGSSLYIYVKTLFGNVNVTEYELTYSIGYTSEPDRSSIVKVGDGLSLVSNELLIIVKDGVSRDGLTELINKYEGEIVGYLSYMNQYQVRFSGYGEEFINSVKSDLETSEIVENISYNLVFDAKTNLIPSDSRYSSWDVRNPSGTNWGLECIDAPSAWNYNNLMSTIKVGVIDTFVNYSHEDLLINKNKTSILPSSYFKTIEDMHSYFMKTTPSHKHTSSSSCLYCILKDHGTHVSGIIGAVSDNNQGVAGVNWYADVHFTSLWYYYIENGQIELVYTSMGRNYAISLMVMSGCRVVNISAGDDEPSEINEYYETPETQAFNYMIKKLEEKNYDFLIIKAAGNENDDASKYMMNRVLTGGEYSGAHTIIVGAVVNSVSSVTKLTSSLKAAEKVYTMASYSNYGNMIDITAPGKDIFNTVFGTTGSEYKNMGGTSMAAPMVAGVASQIYSLNSNFTYDFVKKIICGSANDYCAKNGQLYGIVNAKNAVEAALKYKDHSPRKTPTAGFLTGIVHDAKTGVLLDDIAVYIQNQETGQSYLSVTDGGVYECHLPAGKYTIQFMAQNYLSETVYNIEITEGVINYNALLKLISTSQKSGPVSGRVIDAFTASSIPNAKMEFYKGINNTSGEPVASTVSGSDGRYTISLPPGNYTVYVSAQGYQSDFSLISVAGETSDAQQNCTLTPILKEGEMRIVLTWDEYPEDLDAHLLTPSSNSEQFHIYYGSKNHYYGGSLIGNLDVDDTTSYGPETISVYTGADGTYWLYIHDYTNRELNNSAALSKSGACVKIYIAGADSPVVFNVPNKAGNLWTVCSITNGIITPVNTMEYKETAGNVGK